GLFAESGNLMDGLDWIGKNHDKIQVANISLSDYLDCDGTCPVCKEVDYLSSLGVTVVVGLGNMCDDETTTDTIRRVASPAAASSAITVAGSDDRHTQDLANDIPPDRHVYGPRFVGDTADMSLEGQKPDLTAPSVGIVSMSLPTDPDSPRTADSYEMDSGTSY